MKRVSSLGLSVTLAVVLATAGRAAAEGEAPGGRLLMGADVGVAQAINSLPDYTDDKGFAFGPWVAYMFTRHVGLQGRAEITYFDEDPIEGLQTADSTAMLSFLVGPRFIVPLEYIDFFTAAEVGFMQGVIGDSAVTDSAATMAVSGGFNFPIYENWRVGGFARYTRGFERVHGHADVMYVSGGVSLMYDFNPPPLTPRGGSDMGGVVIE